MTKENSQGSPKNGKTKARGESGKIAVVGLDKGKTKKVEIAPQMNTPTEKEGRKRRDGKA